MININSNLIKIASNYLGKIWNMLSVFLFVPLYIHYLGIENYAIIGFYALILGVISFADAGMSSAVTREFALDETASYKLNILRKIEISYWIIITIIFLIITLSSGMIAKKWLATENISFNDLRNYTILIGVGACIQLISSLYFGALFGLGEQVLANIYQVLWTTFKSLFVILLFIFIKKSLYVFLLWQIICNLIYILILRTIAVKKLKKQIGAKQYFKEEFPTRIIKYIGGMVIVALISSINSQADKIVVSYFFKLETFGYYTIVSILSQIPVLITIPMASFIFPLLSKLSVQNNKMFDIVFEKFVYLLYLIVIPAAILLCYYPLEILLLWTGSAIDSSSLPDLTVLIRVLTIGSTFLAMQFPFYYALLAHSQTKYTVYQGFLQVLLGLPLLYYFAKFYGLKYVGYPWLLINLFGLLYLMYICFNGYIKLRSISFICINVLPVMVISLIIGGVGFLVYQRLQIPFLITLISSGVLTFSSSLIWTNYHVSRSIFSIKYLYDFPRG